MTVCHLPRNGEGVLGKERLRVAQTDLLPPPPAPRPPVWAEGIHEPVRFVLESRVRIYPQSERFWYFSAKRLLHRFTLNIAKVRLRATGGYLTHGDRRHEFSNSVLSLVCVRKAILFVLRSTIGSECLYNQLYILLVISSAAVKTEELYARILIHLKSTVLFCQHAPTFSPSRPGWCRPVSSDRSAAGGGAAGESRRGGDLQKPAAQPQPGQSAGHGGPLAEHHQSRLTHSGGER